MHRRPHTLPGLLLALARLYRRPLAYVFTALVALSFVALVRRAPSRATSTLPTPAAILSRSHRAPVVVAVGDARVVLFEASQGSLALAPIDPKGRLAGDVRFVQYVDNYSAARVGNALIIACARDRNRGDDAEPDMDDVAVWRFDPSRDALEQTFLLAGQNVIIHGDPQVVPRGDGGFHMVWSSWSRLYAQRFDANARAIGAPLRSPPYGDRLTDWRIATLADGATLGVLATETGNETTVRLFPHMEREVFPAPRVIIADSSRMQLSLHLAPREDAVGLLYTTGRSWNVWFTRITHEGQKGLPVLLASTHDADMPFEVSTLASGPKGWLATWNLHSNSTYAAALDASGTLVREPVPVYRYSLWGAASVWSESAWLVFDNTPYAECRLHRARVAADGSSMDARECVYGSEDRGRSSVPCAFRVRRAHSLCAMTLEFNPRWPSRPPSREWCSFYHAIEPDVSNCACPCARCTSYVCARCAAACPGCVVLAKRRALCANPPNVAPRAANEGEYKLAALIRTLGQGYGRDVLIRPWDFSVRCLGSRILHGYVADPDSFVLAQLLFQTNIARLDRPLVAHAPQATVWPSNDHVTQSEIVWLLPGEHDIELRFRLPTDAGVPASPREIPTEGPFALPAPWTPPPDYEVRVGHLDPSLTACPHCGVRSSRFVATHSGFYICAPCGRSFTRAEFDSLPRVEV